jgi:hypothetical protein
MDCIINKTGVAYLHGVIDTKHNKHFVIFAAHIGKRDVVAKKAMDIPQ